MGIVSRQTDDGDRGATGTAIALALAGFFAVAFPPESYPASGIVVAVTLLAGIAWSRATVHPGVAMTAIVVAAVNLALSLAPMRTVQVLAGLLLAVGALIWARTVQGRAAHIPLIGIAVGVAVRVVMVAVVEGPFGRLQVGSASATSLLTLQPFIGTGLGSLDALANGSPWFRIVIEAGVPGIALLVAAVVWWIRSIARSGDRSRRWLLVGVAAFGTAGLVGPLAYRPEVVVPCLLLAGLASARLRVGPHERDSETTVAWTSAATAIVLLLLITVAGMAAGESLAHHRLDRGISATESAPWNTAIQAEAAAIVLANRPTTVALDAVRHGPIRRLIRFDAESPIGWRLDGEVALRSGRLGDAWRSFRQAAIRAPVDPVIRARIEEVESLLRRGGALTGAFEYGLEGEPPPARGVGAWESLLLILYLVAGFVILGARWSPRGLRPELVGLLCLLVLVPWGQGGRIPGAVLGSAILVLITALTAIWPRSERTGAAERVAASWSVWSPALLIVAVALVTFLFSPDRGSSWGGMMSVLWWVVILVLSGLVAADRDAWPRAVVVGLGCSAGLAAAWSLVQRGLVLSGVDLADATAPLALARDGRPAADFFHPGHLGTFLVAAGLALVGATILSSPVRRVRLGLGAALITIGLAQSARATIVALIAGAAVLAWLAAGRRARLAIGAVMVGGILLGGAAITQRFLAGDPYAWTRIEIWTASAEAIRSRPVLGFGPGGFTAFAHQFSFPDVDPTSLSRFGRHFLGPHSDPLSVFLAFGAIGGLGILVAIVLLGRRAIRGLRSADRADPWLVGIAAALVALLGHGLVDDFLRVRPAVAVVAAILLGTLIGRGMAGGREGGPKSRAALRWAVTVGLLFALLAGGVTPWLADLTARNGKPAAAARLYPVGSGYWIRTARGPGGPPLDRLARAVDATGRATRLLGGVDLPWAEAGQVHEDALRGPLPTDDTVNAAIESWSRALKCWPRHVVARRSRGRLLAFRGDLEGALHDFRRAVEDEPYFLGARLDLARVLAALGRPEEAALERAEVRRLLVEIGNAGRPDPYETVLFALTPEERAEVGAAR